MKTNIKSLTSEQKKFYKNNGYLLVENFIAKKTAQKIKQFALKNLAEKPNYPINLNVHRREKLFKDIIKNKNLVNIVESLQKKSVVALNDQMIYKKRGSAYGGQSWTMHQDNAYIKTKKNSYLIVHLFLDDSTPKNGGLIFWAKTHKENILECIQRKSHREKIGKNGVSKPGWTIVPEEQKRIKKHYKKIKIDGKSGALCFMHGNLVHSSSPNKSKVMDRATYSMAYLNNEAKFKNRGYNSVKKKFKLN
jgi:ectoine hydroxylase-related dioxygenase (phytanoyl-CoA dioxygenase family)